MLAQQADAKARFEAVDLAKLAAAAAVVWIHVTNCDESRALLPLCRFAVPFFTCAAVFFVLHNVSSKPTAFGAYCLQRGRRLYLPFILWSFIYLAARYGKQAVAGSSSPIVFSPAMLLNGTTHHLWFLPFICLVSIATFAFAKTFGLPRETRRHWWALACLLIGTALALTPCPVMLQPTEVPMSYFIDHAWDILPAAFFGAALFWLLNDMKRAPWLRGAVLFVGLLFLAWELFDDGHPIRPHLAGATILFFTITEPNRKWMTAFWPWAQLAFLIYLVHVLFVEILQTTATRFGGVQSLAADLSVWALSLAVSALAAKAVLRCRAAAWLSPR
jgi:surface polysaccharide O-acyltransferase-like enzyme